MKIDVDANISQMIESYVNGNRNEVIQALADDHPGLTAFFLTEAIKRKAISYGDVNTITNRLIDARREAALEQESIQCHHDSRNTQLS